MLFTATEFEALTEKSLTRFSVKLEARPRLVQAWITLVSTFNETCLRSVTGRPEDQAFASHLTGADNLIMTVPILFDQLGQKCLEALAHYGSHTYRERYPWIDNFTRIKDPAQIAELDNALVETLRTEVPENVFLTPPDTLDAQEHRGFRYHYERDTTPLHANLKLKDFLAGLRSDQITIANLKKWRIREYTSSDDIPSRHYQVYEAFIHEVARGPKLYALSFGEWFEISQDHVTAVNNQLRQIADHHELILVEATVGETEGEYNRRAALASNGTFALLDAQPVMYGGGRSSIEICDLLSIDRIFVHVKAKTKSSILSHLFAQGVNSAQAFRDASFRLLALEKCPPSHRAIFQGEPRTGDHTITYSIMTQAAGDLRDALPFFMQAKPRERLRFADEYGIPSTVKEDPSCLANEHTRQMNPLRLGVCWKLL